MLAPVATLEQLLASAAGDDPQAVVALYSRMAGLVRLNVRRILGDASRSERVTQQLFSDLRRDAVDFDPRRTSAHAWLLAQAHERAMDELKVDQTAAGSYS